MAVLVDDEHAVGVAVEGQPQGQFVLDDVTGQVDEVVLVQRVGRVVGEGAVQLEEQRVERDRQGVEHQWCHAAGHAVSGIRCDVQWCQGIDVDHGVEVGHVGIVDAAGGARAWLGGRHEALLEEGRGAITHGRQAGPQ